MLALIATWFTAPSATTTMDSIGTYSSAMFDQLFTIVPILVGLVVGGLIVSAIFRYIMKGIGKVVGKKGGKRRRR